MDREELIEVVARRVLEELDGGHHGPSECCAECSGGCAANCSDKVRCMVDEGACRISYNGNGADVPADLATLHRPHVAQTRRDGRARSTRLCEEAVAVRLSPRSASTRSGSRGRCATFAVRESRWPRWSASRSAPTPRRSRRWSAAGAARRGARDRHGDQHRRPQRPAITIWCGATSPGRPRPAARSERCKVIIEAALLVRRGEGRRFSRLAQPGQGRLRQDLDRLRPRRRQRSSTSR